MSDQPDEGKSATTTTTTTTKKSSNKPQHPLECIICAAGIDVAGVFDCGHFCCAICALRVHSFMKGQGCPMCRNVPKELIVCDDSPEDDWSFDVAALKAKYPKLYANKSLGCKSTKLELLERLEKLTAYLCPEQECWENGEQEPFSHLGGLKDHMSKDHKLRYCNICLDHRPAFFCEQYVYTDKELDLHNSAKCRKDVPSFQGHPLCYFCSQRVYDADALIKHMQHHHFTCDVCNRGEFIFTYYRNRNKLLEHLGVAHKLCQHKDCQHLDPMLRVYANDIELSGHSQRVHGSKQTNVSLDSLGFQFSSATSGTSNRGGGRGGGGGGNNTTTSPTTTGPQRASVAPFISSNPSTGAEAHAARVYFDNVTNLQELDLTPTTQKQTGAVRGGGGGRGGDDKKDTSSPGSYANVANATKVATAVALPEHYESKNLRRALKPITIDAPVDHHHQSSASNNKGGSSSTTNSSGVTKKSGSPKKAAKQNYFEEADIVPDEEEGENDSPSNSQSSRNKSLNPDAPSYRPPERNVAPPEEIVLKYQPSEYDAILKTKLATHLSSLQFDSFRQMSSEFLANKLLATAYYEQLSNFFPNPNVLKEILEPLVGSLRNETKRDALIAARKMMTCREVRQRQEAEAEAERERVALEQEQRGGGKKGGGGSAHRGAQATQGSNMWEKRKQATESAKKDNAVWNGKRTTGGKGGGDDNGPSLPSEQKDGPVLSRPAAANTWGGGSATSSSKPNEYFDPNSFPSLGGGSKTKRGVEKTNDKIPQTHKGDWKKPLANAVGRSGEGGPDCKPTTNASSPPPAANTTRIGGITIIRNSGTGKKK